MPNLQSDGLVESLLIFKIKSVRTTVRVFAKLYNITSNSPIRANDRSPVVRHCSRSNNVAPAIGATLTVQTLGHSVW